MKKFNFFSFVMLVSFFLGGFSSDVNAAGLKSQTKKVLYVDLTDPNVDVDAALKQAVTMDKEAAQDDRLVLREHSAAYREGALDASQSSDLQLSHKVTLPLFGGLVVGGYFKCIEFLTERRNEIITGDHKLGMKAINTIFWVCVVGTVIIVFYAKFRRAIQATAK